MVDLSKAFQPPELIPYSFHPVHGHGYSSEVFFYLAIEYERAASIYNGAKATVGFGEKGCFNQAGVVFKSEELHGFAAFGMYDLSGN
jgi:hypothetical protein